jgi:outer membrane receptor protein involved in Fe transport
VRSKATLLLSALVGYEFNKHWTLQAEVFNLLDSQNSAIDYYYQSQLSGETAPVNDIHFHPVEPLSFRLSLTTKF